MPTRMAQGPGRTADLDPGGRVCAPTNRPWLSCVRVAGVVSLPVAAARMFRPPPPEPKPGHSPRRTRGVPRRGVGPRGAQAPGSGIAQPGSVTPRSYAKAVTSRLSGSGPATPRRPNPPNPLLSTRPFELGTGRPVADE